MAVSSPDTISFTRGALGSSNSASFVIARCQSQVSSDSLHRSPFSFPSHQLQMLSFAYHLDIVQAA